jgi:hypothetical protein
MTDRISLHFISLEDYPCQKRKSQSKKKREKREKREKRIYDQADTVAGW